MHAKQAEIHLQTPQLKQKIMKQQCELLEILLSEPMEYRILDGTGSMAEMLGILKKIKAYVEIFQEPLTMELVERVLKGI